ncbi:hypothetical protein [Fictibacillus enclensis]|uniref:hypothetical protein n=1 Tax=Fictibacillus enclensis TaxID=1017270 RepID=UPI0024BF71E8|nr:hypothetical protein [Fictibacillus enclensis]WHY71787.1 hypothetical protein QNH15_22765 [Fictibacillus enclensis]
MFVWLGLLLPGALFITSIYGKAYNNSTSTTGNFCVRDSQSEITIHRTRWNPVTMGTLLFSIGSIAFTLIYYHKYF